MMKNYYILLICLALGCIGCKQQAAEPKTETETPVNYEEEKIPAYVLPDVLQCEDGTMVQTVADWEGKRRNEVLNYFVNLEYGQTPQDQIQVSHEEISMNPNALGGKAISRQVRFIFSNGEQTHEAILLLLLPKKEGKLPIFFAFNFKGNQSTLDDTDILYSPGLQYVEKRDSLMDRGGRKNRWDYNQIIDRGYAIGTMFYEDIHPDGFDREAESVKALFPKKNSSEKAPNEWGAIGVWAWAASRVADYLVQQDWVDTSRMAIMGHSRLGKTALWAGAQDSRFKVVISNDSGCAGASLSKRNYGENLGRITKVFTYWFCPAFCQFAENEEALPFDQHELLALIAPRHAYVASASDDRWADPKGEYLALYHAGKVYELYGLQGLPSEEMPGIEQPIITDVGHHIRKGFHDVTDYDWKCYLDYCDEKLK